MDRSPRDLARRDLAPARHRRARHPTEPNPPEWRFDIAYNAVLQAAVAALAASGFRPERQNKHARAIECLEHTLGVDERRVRFFDRCRRKRHTAVYEKVGAISNREADELHEAATRVHSELVAWLRKQYPKLVGKQRPPPGRSGKS